MIVRKARTSVTIQQTETGLAQSDKTRWMPQAEKPDTKSRPREIQEVCGYEHPIEPERMPQVQEVKSAAQHDADEPAEEFPDRFEKGRKPGIPAPSSMKKKAIQKRMPLPSIHSVCGVCFTIHS